MKPPGPVGSWWRRLCVGLALVCHCSWLLAATPSAGKLVGWLSSLAATAGGVLGAALEEPVAVLALNPPLGELAVVYPVMLWPLRMP